MATELADIANDAAVKIGGFGDQFSGSGQITQTQLDANADNDRVSQAINTKYPVVRKRIYEDFAARKTPFKETQKFAGLGADLKRDDLSIATIAVDSGTFQITIVTQAVHNLTTGDTRFMFGIRDELKTSAGNVDSLNGKTVTVTVVDTLTFTIDTLVGTAVWDHTENTGIISKVPNIGPYIYAFDMPSDFHALVRQTLEGFSTKVGTRREYQCDTILNRDSDGQLLVTNQLTNSDRSSAYIEYVFDQTTISLFSPALLECLAMMLGYELSPMVGRDFQFRQNMMAEYRALTVPEAMRNINASENNFSEDIPDFSGFRSRGGVGVTARGNLGTYRKADGTRAEIFP